MTSNGETFRVAVLQGDEKYRRFVKGTNSAIYEKLDGEGKPEATKSQEGTMKRRKPSTRFQICVRNTSLTR